MLLHAFLSNLVWITLLLILEVNPYSFNQNSQSAQLKKIHDSTNFTFGQNSSTLLHTWVQCDWRLRLKQINITNS